MSRLDLRFVMTATDMHGLDHIATDKLRGLVGIAYGAFDFRDI